MYTADEYYFAESLGDAKKLLEDDSKNAILGGGMWMRLGKAHYHTIIDLSRLGLDQIELKDGYVVIGAMTTLRSLETNELLKSRYHGAIGEAVHPIVGTQFRNMATIGGSVAGRYGFSDVLTVLAALEAEVEIFEKGRFSLADYLEGKTEKGILTHIWIPDDGRQAVCLSLRPTKTDFSTLNLCMSVKDQKYCVAIGSRPGGALRSPEAELALQEKNIEKAKEFVSALPYGSNQRGSAEYRKAMAAVLVERAYARLEDIT